MEQLQEQPRGILPQVAVVALMLLTSTSRAAAQAPALGEERPWQAPGSLGVDPLTGERGSPLATDPQEVLSQWKKFQPTPLPTKEGEIVFLNPAARARGTVATIAPAPWKKWLLPAGVSLAGAALLAGCLGAWRFAVRRRAAQTAEIASRYLPLPGSRK